MSIPVVTCALCAQMRGFTWHSFTFISTKTSGLKKKCSNHVTVMVSDGSIMVFEILHWMIIFISHCFYICNQNNNTGVVPQITRSEISGQILHRTWNSYSSEGMCIKENTYAFIFPLCWLKSFLPAVTYVSGQRLEFPVRVQVWV